VPTLAADDALADCLRSLETQTLDRFEVIVVDNSGARRAQASGARVRLISNDHNAGFGAAVNQAYRDSASPYLATLNDDTVAEPQWLEALVSAAEACPRAGMFASEVRMAATALLDSAGMLIAMDGSSKQRGHGEPPKRFAKQK
jgi:GT2 family glycosyltransferase